MSVEPYKCDNSRLLAECNQLHLELLKHKEEAQLKTLESRRTLRSLQTDKKCLEEQCVELAEQIKEMFACGGTQRKEMRKPFVSTVRPKSAMTAIDVQSKKSGNLGSKCLKCSCSCGKDSKAGNSILRLRNDVQSQGDFISELQSQVRFCILLFSISRQRHKQFCMRMLGITTSSSH